MRKQIASLYNGRGERIYPTNKPLYPCPNSCDTDPNGCGKGYTTKKGQDCDVCTVQKQSSTN